MKTQLNVDCMLCTARWSVTWGRSCWWGHTAAFSKEKPRYSMLKPGCIPPPVQQKTIQLKHGTAQSCNAPSGGHCAPSCLLLARWPKAPEEKKERQATPVWVVGFVLGRVPRALAIARTSQGQMSDLHHSQSGVAHSAQDLHHSPTALTTLCPVQCLPLLQLWPPGWFLY